MYSFYGLGRLFDELTLSYSLLFGQSDSGLKILNSVLKIPVRRAPPNVSPDSIDRQLSAVKELRVISWKDSSLRYFGARSNPPSVDDFILLGGRLEALQRQMRDWRPRRIRQVFNPGYGDRFTWYIQMFALLIAVLGTLGLFFSIVQTAYTIRSYNDTMRVALESLEVALASLNVSIEQLTLQKLQMNLTV
jgi:hypothetical protein